jgi:hypothetical protein
MHVSGWTGANYQFISYVFSSMQGNEGQPSKELQGIRIWTCLKSRTKQETRALRMGVAQIKRKTTSNFPKPTAGDNE